MVFGICLGVIGFDFILRLTIVEKSKVRVYLEVTIVEDSTSPLSEEPEL